MDQIRFKDLRRIQIGSEWLFAPVILGIVILIYEIAALLGLALMLIAVLLIARVIKKKCRSDTALCFFCFCLTMIHSINWIALRAGHGPESAGLVEFHFFGCTFLLISVVYLINLLYLLSG